MSTVRSLKSMLQPSPRARWVPSIALLPADGLGQMHLSRACRYFEPHARVHVCADLADAFYKVVSRGPDLLIVDPSVCEDKLPALLHHARRLRPGLTVALVGSIHLARSSDPQALRADAVLDWSELPMWLGQTLPRLRCRAELAALTEDPFSDTTQPLGLGPAA
jgi:hypothetical protein